MIASLLATVGIPALVDVVKGALGKIDNPVANIAVNALGDVHKAIKTNKITPEQVQEANRHTEKLKELETKENIATLAQINETIRSEYKSGDKFVSRWRPTYGYCVAFSWAWIMFTAGYCIVYNPTEAPKIINSLMQLNALYGVALAVLGVNIHSRSKDKKTHKGMN